MSGLAKHIRRDKTLCYSSEPVRKDANGDVDMSGPWRVLAVFGPNVNIGAVYKSAYARARMENPGVRPSNTPANPSPPDRPLALLVAAEGSQ